MRAAVPVTLALLVLVFSTALAAAQEIRPLTRAWIAVSDAPEPPPPASPAWQPVTLTDRWPAERYASGRLAWYRIPLTLDERPTEPLGILLRRTNMNARLYLNGEQIASGGRFEEPVSRNWNRPLYAVPSLALWRAGENHLYLRHISHPGYGYVSPLYLGPDRLLGPEYDRLFLLQVQIARYLFPITVALSLFMFFIWLRLREERHYLWFSLAIGFWSVYILNMFVRDLVIPTKAWEWIAHFSVDAWVIFFALFMHSFVGDRLRVRSRLYGAFLVTAGVTYAAVDLTTLKAVVPVFHGISVLIGCSVSATMLWRWWRTDRSRTLAILNVCLLVLLGTGIHDWMFQTGMVGLTGPVSLHFHYYAAPLVFAFITWHLTARFADTIAGLARLNAELESRVAAAEASLEERFAQIGRMERQQAVMAERERLAREIHDGVSGNLSNAIMLADLMGREAPSPRLGNLKNLLQDGLTEVRQLATAMAGDLSSLDSVARYIAGKAENVLSAADIPLTVSIGDVGGFRPLSQSESLNLVRIFQEALTNIVKHAGADSVRLACRLAGDAAVVEIQDNGVGLADRAHAGYGLANLKKRAADISASLQIDSPADGGRGTRIRLTLAAAPG